MKKKHGRYSCCDTANKNIDFIIFPPVAFFFFFTFPVKKEKLFPFSLPGRIFLGAGGDQMSLERKSTRRKSFGFLALWAGWAGWMDGWHQL